MLKLKAAKRDTKIKPQVLRAGGQIPAVFYGRTTPSTPISVSEIDFKKVWEEGGESSVVSLETPEGEVESLIHEVDFDPITGVPRHADFYVFEKGHKVTVEVPLVLEGVSPAVKELGGSIVMVLHDLEVEAMPKDLPHDIKVEISSLVDFQSQILAGDIALPSGVTLVTGPEEVVVLVSAPREEKEEEAAPIDLSSIEVEKKGKEETEADGTAETAAEGAPAK